MKRFFIKDTYLKSIISVTLGSVAAQIITLLTTLVLTRIYSPEQYGIYATILSIVTIFVTIASGRYDLSIFIPQNLNDSRTLVVLCLVLNIMAFIFVFYIIFVFNNYLNTVSYFQGLGSWLYLLPFTAIFVSINQIYITWLGRLKNIPSLNVFRIANSSLFAVICIVLGFKKVTHGLFLGYFISNLLLAIYSIYNFKFFFNSFHFNRLKSFALSYKNFPLYSLPSTLAGEIGAQLPIFLLALYFSNSITGQFLLAKQIVSLPVLLIGNSVATVYRQQAIENFNISGRCDDFFLRTLWKLFFIGLIPLIIMLFYGKYLVTLIFGSEWETAGTLAVFMSVLSFFQLLSSPLADTILFINGQKLDFKLQFSRLLINFVAIVIGGINNNYELAIGLYVISYSLYYVIHSIIQFRIAKGLLTELE